MWYVCPAEGRLCATTVEEAFTCNAEERRREESGRYRDGEKTDASSSHQWKTTSLILQSSLRFDLFMSLKQKRPSLNTNHLVNQMLILETDHQIWSMSVFISRSHDWKTLSCEQALTNVLFEICFNMPALIIHFILSPSCQSIRSFSETASIFSFSESQIFLSLF